MPYDAGAEGAERGKSNGERRGPLRPSRLASARSRLGGGSLTRLVQATDLALLAGLFVVKCHGDALSGSNPLLLAASVLV
ncbi:MAG: hypothetical protein ACXWKO_14115, partial [Phenylobacterium sp.]